MGGVETHVRGTDVGVARDIDLHGRARVEWRIGTYGKNRVEIAGVGGSNVDRYYDGAIDLSTGNFEQSCQRYRCQPAHTSETHRHPERKMFVSNELDRSDYCNDCWPSALAEQYSVHR